MISHLHYLHQIAESSHLQRYKIYGDYSFLYIWKLWSLVISNIFNWEWPGVSNIRSQDTQACKRMSHHTNHQSSTSPLLAVSANGLATAVPAVLSVSHPLIFTSTGPAGGAELPGSRAMEEREEERPNSSGVGWLGGSAAGRGWRSGGRRSGGRAPGTPPLPLFSILLVSLAALAAVRCLLISYIKYKIIPPSQHEARVTYRPLPRSLQLPASPASPASPPSPPSPASPASPPAPQTP